MKFPSNAPPIKIVNSVDAEAVEIPYLSAIGPINTPICDPKPDCEKNASNPIAVKLILLLFIKFLHHLHLDI